MKDRTMRRLKRAELLELLIEQKKKNETLEKELAEARAELKERRLKLQDCGDLAQASLAITDIFLEAQKSADLYLENIKMRAEFPEETESRANPAAEEKDRKVQTADPESQGDETCQNED